MLRFSHELRHGFRLLLRNPSFGIVAVLTIALGTGASIAIFSVVNSTLLRPLPYEDPARLTLLGWSTPASEATIPVSPVDLRDWRQQSESFEALAGYHRWTFTLTGEDEAERVRGAVLTAGLLELLGARPQIGRTFEVDGPEAPPAVILSHDFWQRRFGAEAGVLGRKLLLDGEPVEVIGVMPSTFRFPVAHPAELWQVSTFAPEDLPRDMRFLQVLGRLREGVRLDAAQTEMSAIAAQHEQQYGDTNGGLGARVTALHDSVVKDFRRNLVLLQAAVLLALAIGGFNVAILQLTRASQRRGEIAVRVALGAGRGHLLRQLLGESLVLGFCGGALGLVVAYWGTRLLIRFAPQSLFRLEESTIDGRVLVFALLVTVLSSLIFGLAPASFSRFNLSQILRQAGRSESGPSWGHQLFVFLQVAVTLVLLVVAGLLMRSFVNLSSVSPGFRPEGLLTLQITLPAGPAPLEQTSAFYTELKERVEALPGAESLATCFSLPMSRGMRFDNDFEIEGRPREPSDPELKAWIRPVSPNFFSTLGIPLVEGRTFTEHDGAASPGVVVVNQEAARRFWSGASPVGDRLKTQVDLGAELGRLEKDTWEVVGVVGDVRHQGLASAVEPEIFVSTLQNPWQVMNLVVRTSSDPSALAKPVASEIHAMDSSLPVVRVHTMEEILSDSLSQPRFSAWLAGIFAAFALALTALGLYGVLSYSVTRRRREIGLRMALGASRRDVLTLEVRRGMTVTAVGLAAGLAGAFFAVQLLAGLIFGVTSTDPRTFAAACLLLALVAFAASYLPARRAATLDPMATLRYE